jgi:hypothetical protein
MESLRDSRSSRFIFSISINEISPGFMFTVLFPVTWLKTVEKFRNP